MSHRRIARAFEPGTGTVPVPCRWPLQLTWPLALALAYAYARAGRSSIAPMLSQCPALNTLVLYFALSPCPRVWAEPVG